MVGSARRRSPIVSNSGTTIRSLTADRGGAPSAGSPRIRPVSLNSSSTSSRSLASWVCEMM
jgi:hypothetical protein